MVVSLVLAMLATYRLSTDLAWEAGPYRVYEKVRGRVLARYGADDWRSEGVTCPICLSFWLALPAGLLLDFGPMGLVYWLAIAGAVALAVRVTSHGR